MNMSTQVRQAGRLPLTPSLFDSDGFLLQTDNWSRELAALIAEEEGLQRLTMNHWRVINYVRDRYQAFEYPPLMRNVCRATALEKTQVKSLFGNCRKIWRIAGLPNPGDEAIAYM